MRTTLAIAALAALAPLTSARAGDLDPPAGPITPTMKTLDQVEPRIPIGPDTTPGDANSVFEINGSGSYYLTGNVSAPVGFNGIEIESSNVTIDLNGFTVAGTPGGDAFGIGASGEKSHIVVRNGTVANFDRDGVDLGNDDYAVVEDVLSYGHGMRGITVGDFSRVARCVTRNNINSGVTADNSCRIESTASHNNALGFEALTDSVFTDCISRNNASDGFLAASGQVVFERCASRGDGHNGFDVGPGSVLRGCSVELAGAAGSTDDDTAGVLLGDRSILENCTANDCMGDGVHGAGTVSFAGHEIVIRGSTFNGNGGAGVAIGDGVRVVDSVAGFNGAEGIHIGQGGSVEGCSARDNTTVGIRVGGGAVLNCVARNNFTHGITVSGNGLVKNCLAERNDGIGLSVSVTSTVIDCRAYFNDSHGIQASTDSVVQRCTVDSNGGSGIRGSGGSLRIDGNHATDNAIGFEIIGSDSVVVKNTADSNSTNYSVAAGNIVGTIRTSITGAGPWDNFDQ